jgi:hypothetical protein
MLDDGDNSASVREGRVASSALIVAEWRDELTRVTIG